MKITAIRYKVGDIVFVKRNPITTGYSTKRQSTFSCTFVIIHLELNTTIHFELES